MNGRKVERLRREQGMSQVELAEKIGVRQATISRIEASRQNLSLNLLQRVADALNVAPADLLTEDPQPVAA
jgi:transcriptional regulator with XRE-family HTH domain